MQISKGPIGILIKDKPVHIYGAGISGLLMGLYLKKSGFQIKIFEKENRVGGKIHTYKHEFGIAETAANAVYTNDDVIELLHELNLDYIPATKKLKKIVWRNCLPKTPPFYLKELFYILFRMFKKIPKNLHELSVADFFIPLTGKVFCSEVISSALGGIYAEDADKLHFQSIFKTSINKGSYFNFFLNLIKARKNKHRPTSVSFKNGMQSFIDALREELSENIELNSTNELDLTVNNIICTDALDASKLVENLNPLVSKELTQIKYNYLNSTTIISNKNVMFLEKSFGVLFPQNLQQSTIGILHNTAIFPRRTIHSSYKSYTVISKGEIKEEEKILEEFLTFTTLSDEDILFYKTSSWKRAIPIYDKNRYNTILSIRSHMLDQKGLVLFGNYIDGISIREMVTMAKEFAYKNSLINNEKTFSSIKDTSTSAV